MLCLDCKELVCPKCFVKSKHREHDVEAADDVFSEVINKVKGLSKWDEKLAASNRKLDECFGLLEQKSMTEIAKGFDERTEAITKAKKEALEKCSEYFRSIKHKYIRGRIAPNKVTEADFLGDNRSRANNLQKGIEIYKTDISSRVNDIRKVIEFDSLSGMIEEASRL